MSLVAKVANTTSGTKTLRYCRLHLKTVAGWKFECVSVKKGLDCRKRDARGAAVWPQPPPRPRVKLQGSSPPCRFDRFLTNADLEIRVACRFRPHNRYWICSPSTDLLGVHRTSGGVGSLTVHGATTRNLCLPCCCCSAACQMVGDASSSDRSFGRRTPLIQMSNTLNYM